MFLNSFYIITIIKKPAANTVLKTIFAFYSIDNSSLKLPWAALKYCRIGDSCAVPVSFVTFACFKGDCEHVRLVSCEITIWGGYEIRGVVSCITSISVCFLFMLNWWTRLDHAGRSWPSNRHSSDGFTQTSRFLEAEALFTAKKITREKTRFDHFIRVLPAKYVSQVGDIILWPLEDSSMALNIQPIFGADFLLQHKLLVDLEQRRLIDIRYWTRVPVATQASFSWTFIGPHPSHQFCFNVPTHWRALLSTSGGLLVVNNPLNLITLSPKADLSLHDHAVSRLINSSPPKPSSGIKFSTWESYSLPPAPGLLHSTGFPKVTVAGSLVGTTVGWTKSSRQHATPSRTSRILPPIGR